MNIVFRMFFNLYLEEQEDAQMRSIGKGINSYISSMLDAQLGNANDWSHWNDTYAFVNGKSPNYERDNLNADTFLNLNASFIIYTLGDSIFKKQYFDLDHGQFADFAAGFDSDFTRVAEAAGKAEDISGIFKLGDSFYLVSASDITDSLNKVKPIGEFVIGQRIDNRIISAVAGIAGGSVVSLDAGSPHPGIEQLMGICHLLVASRDFASRHTGEVEPGRALAALVERYRPDVAAVTLGEAGGLWHEGGHTGAYPAFRVPVVDTTGAGDVFHSAFARFMLKGLGAAEAARMASAAAALKCTRAGGRAGIPTEGEVRAFVSRAAE
jgi:hypothetical protein